MEENISQPEKEFSPSSSPKQTIPNPKPKFSLILTGILLLVLGGVGGFLLGRQSLQPKSTTTTQVTPLPSEAPVEERVTETPSAIPTLDPTAEWKTYIDTNNTFSFRYPADWILNEDKEISLKKSDPSQEKVLLPGEKKEEASYQITLSIENNPKELSAKDFYLANFAPENKAQAKSKLQELDIAGQKAILYDEGAVLRLAFQKLLLFLIREKFTASHMEQWLMKIPI